MTVCEYTANEGNDPDATMALTMNIHKNLQIWRRSPILRRDEFERLWNVWKALETKNPTKTPLWNNTSPAMVEAGSLQGKSITFGSGMSWLV